ncbi:MAG: hypothetical protein ACKVQJ_07240 [Pyrinomonadaceae bacterium]
MKKLISTFVAFGILFVLGTGIAAAQDAVDVTDNFYATVGDLNIRGLPDKDQLREITPFLSSEVIAIIKRDQKKQNAFIKKHPDEKPPWAEGDLFSSLFEGRTSYGIGKMRAKGITREVDVYLQFNGETDKVKWTDTVVLKKFGGKWVITNILFKGKWQFKSGGSLLKVLR